MRIRSKVGVCGALMLVGLALNGCGKKDNYSADTSAAAIDTTGAYTASSTAPVVVDTPATATTTTKTTTKKSTGKSAPKKPTY